MSRCRRDDSLLDRLLQLDAEPTHLRLLQPRLPGGLQEHAAVRVPLLGQAQSLQCLLRVKAVPPNVIHGWTCNKCCDKWRQLGLFKSREAETDHIRYRNNLQEM